jgi:hypothetical protein
MGYVYEIGIGGRRSLVCEVCGSAGARKRPCKYGYCPAEAICSGCFAEASVKSAFRAYHEDNCKEAAAEYDRRKREDEALLAAGHSLFRSAISEGDLTRISFRNSAGDYTDVLVTNEVYKAVHAASWTDGAKTATLAGLVAGEYGEIGDDAS